MQNSGKLAPAILVLLHYYTNLRINLDNGKSRISLIGSKILLLDL